METTGEDAQTTLQRDGVVLLRNSLRREELTLFRQAAVRCFDAIARMERVPEQYRFIPQVHSLLLTSLLDFGIESEAALTEPLSAEGLGALFSELVGQRWRCRLEHSWLRKKFALRDGGKYGYYLQDWHQDGALGIHFPPEPGPPIPPATMATCWIPLDPCGRDAPGLEFIHASQPALLHFTELNDAHLRRRFEAALFWAPELESGDALVFRSDVLHRTHVTPEMRSGRMSIEYRIFPE